MTMIGVVKPAILFGEYDASANRMPVYQIRARIKTHVGDIRDAIWGWTYVAKGTEGSGKLFSTLDKLKAHLRETL